MRYVSTRGISGAVTAAEAITAGLAPDGGLYTPETIPQIAPGFIEALCGMSYAGRAKAVMELYLDDFSPEELSEFTKSAYEGGKFGGNAAPVRMLEDGLSVLELWHGPTSAFKDMALQILPYLMKASLEKAGETRRACILVATSGDTGKAALEGFKDVAGTGIMVFYPQGGVSEVQKLQMTSQEGANTCVCAVEGNFDDAQNGVKAIFSDAELKAELDRCGFFLSSANSINWGRLLPQIAYYFSAYCDLVNDKRITEGEKISFCVPSGNFGNILAGYFALRMGLPVNRLVCASNVNNVLADFIESGVYDRRRTLYQSVSPSMDILISSNLERLLFYLSGMDGVLVRGYMENLAAEGHYEVDAEILAGLKGIFTGGWRGEEETKSDIKAVYERFGYLMDTHTAVAYGVYSGSSAEGMTVIVSTASPFKFSESVLEALGAKTELRGIELFPRLATLTGTEIPRGLADLEVKSVRFTDVVKRDAMRSYVLEHIGELF